MPEEDSEKEEEATIVEVFLFYILLNFSPSMIKWKWKLTKANLLSISLKLPSITKRRLNSQILMSVSQFLGVFSWCKVVPEINKFLRDFK